jgi:segregation and condensation protein A
MDGSAPSASDQGVLPLENWDRPPRRQPGPATAPVLAVDGFEGPLDWLVDLARTRRIDLARLSIAALVEAFAEALTAALETPDLRPTLLGRWGDWLVMAADLTLLRSRLLVPADAAAAQDAQDEAERLRQRLLGRVEIGRAADWLERRIQLGRDVFGRGQVDGAGVVRAGRAGDITALLRACLAAIRLPPDAGAAFRVAGPPFWSAADAAERIRDILPNLGQDGAPLASFLPHVPVEAPERGLRCRVAVSGTFLAGLELAREGSIAVQQETTWATIQVRPGQGPTSTEAIA